MKVLYFITKSNWGGAQRYVYDLATNVPKDWEPVVAVGGDGLFVKKLREKNIRVIPLPEAQRDIAIFKEIKLLINLFEIVRREKPDVLHVNSSKLAGLGSFVGFITRARTIATVHGWAFNEDRNAIAKAIIYFFSWLTSVFATITITITKSDYVQGKSMPLVGHKMQLIHNAIEQVNFHSREDARAKLGLKNDELVVGTIAELTPNKGLTYLAEVAEQIPEAKFVVMGDGELRSELEKTKLKLLGFVPEANRYLRAFDVFVLPSLKEGLPYVLLEATQAGLPIVASNVGGIPDIVGTAGLLVPPKNSDLLARAIKTSLKETRTPNYPKFSFPTFLSQTYKLYK